MTNDDRLNALLGRHPKATAEAEENQAEENQIAPNAEGAYTLRDFLINTAERDNPGEVFELESNKMLEAKVNGRIWSKLGAMVAYHGDLTFKREGMMEGGLMKAFQRAVSQEMSALTKIEGNGVVYLADGERSEDFAPKRRLYQC